MKWKHVSRYMQKYYAVYPRDYGITDEDLWAAGIVFKDRGGFRLSYRVADAFELWHTAKVTRDYGLDGDYDDIVVDRPFGDMTKEDFIETVLKPAWALDFAEHKAASAARKAKPPHPWWPP